MPRTFAAFAAGLMVSSLLTIPGAGAEDAAPCVPETPVADMPATPLENVTQDPVPASPNPVASEAPAAAVPTYAASPRFSEFLPDPVGDDAAEFMELQNPGTEEIPLAGWSISDSKGHFHIFTDSSIAPEAHLYLMYAESKLRLTNTGGTFVLTDPSGAVRDQVSYPSPVPVGKSYSLFGSEWRWVSPTPGTENADDTMAPVPVTAVVAPSAAGAVATTATIASTESSTATNTAASGTSSAPATDSNLKIGFSAMLPNPEGTDVAEWVELHNAGTAAATLTGWNISDLSDTAFVFDGISILPGGTFRVMKSESHISLNNDTETVRLTAPDGTIKETVTYANAPSGVAYAKGPDGTWHWDTGATGAVAGSLAETDGVTGGVGDDAAQSSGAGEVANGVADLGAYSEGETAIIEAVVTAPPGVIGKSTFAVRDTASEQGAVVRIYGKGPYPVMKRGDAVRIIGRVKFGDTSRLATTAHEIEVIGGAAPLGPVELSPEDLRPSDEGLEVLLRGLVASRGKRSVTLSDDAGTVELAARLVRGEMPAVSEGDSVSLVGIAYLTGKGMEVIVPDQTAVEVEKTAAVAESAGEPIATTQSAASRPTLDLSTVGKFNATPWVAALALTAAGLIGFAIWRKKEIMEDELDGL